MYKWIITDYLEIPKKTFLAMTFNITEGSCMSTFRSLENGAWSSARRPVSREGFIDAIPKVGVSKGGSLICPDLPYLDVPGS